MKFEQRRECDYVVYSFEYPTYLIDSETAPYVRMHDHWTVVVDERIWRYCYDGDVATVEFTNDGWKSFLWLDVPWERVGVIVPPLSDMSKALSWTEDAIWSLRRSKPVRSHQ